MDYEALRCFEDSTLWGVWGGLAPSRDFWLQKNLYLIGVIGLLASPALLAAGISATDKYAWAENIGWIRLSGTVQNATTYPLFKAHGWSSPTR